MDYLKETTELKEEYLASEKRFTEFQSLTSKQFLCYHEALDVSTSYWREAAVYKLHKPEKMVQDEGILERAITPQTDNDFWRSYDVGQAFTQMPVHPYLLFFDLKQHKHCWVHVDACKPYKYKPELADKIVLPDVQDLEMHM